MSDSGRCRGWSSRALLFIENRELLDGDAPRRNPAIEWDRLAAVLRDSVVKLVDPGLNLPGGSTLATQIEKYRHAPAGRTEDATAKLRQMVSASLRAYRNGPDTSAGAGSWWSTISTRRRSAPAPASAR